MSDQSSAAGTVPADAPYPPAVLSWGLILLLMVTYVFSYVDRAIIGYLIEPIKADLKISDEQFGWIVGLAFSVFYATMAIPLGWLVDRKRRTWVLATGVAVWSIATAVSGLARNFWHLFLARLGVGAGEATLSPAAFSMIGDAFPEEKRAKPIAVYTMALVVGGSIASFVSGFALTVSKELSSVSLPLLGALEPWRLTFIAVGLPGLILAVIFFFLPEPKRRVMKSAADQVTGSSIADTLAFVGNRIGTYAGFISLICVMTILAYGQTNFFPGAFERLYGWDPSFYAYVNGTGILIVGIPTYLCVGYFSDYWSQKGIKDAPFRLLMFGYLLMVPTGIFAMLMPNAWLAYGLLALNNIGIGVISAAGITSLLLITPGKIRGQMVALYYLSISMSGLLLGPGTVGTLSTRVFGEENLHLAIATLPAIYGIIPAILLPVIRRLYLAQMERLHGPAA
ncbi:MAG: MFS transporter [Pseudomonadota bacterium]